MDIISWVKTLLIGYLGAGGFYIVASFTYLYFPLPLFAKMRTMLTSWARGRHKKKGTWMAKLWYVGSFGLIALMSLAWWITLGLYGCVLYILLHRYVTTDANDIWIYFSVAMVLPAIWAIYRYIRFFNAKKEEKVEEKEDDRTLLERMMQ